MRVNGDCQEGDGWPKKIGNHSAAPALVDYRPRSIGGRIAPNGV